MTRKDIERIIEAERLRRSAEGRRAAGLAGRDAEGLAARCAAYRRRAARARTAARVAVVAAMPLMFLATMAFLPAMPCSYVAGDNAINPWKVCAETDMIIRGL